MEELTSISDRAEIVLVHLDLTRRVLSNGQEVVVPGKPAEDVLDATAAGDSFAAAYLQARLAGKGPQAAAQSVHHFTGQVVRYCAAML